VRGWRREAVWRTAWLAEAVSAGRIAGSVCRLSLHVQQYSSSCQCSVSICVSVCVACVCCPQVHFHDTSRHRGLAPKFTEMFGFSAASLGPQGVAYISPAAGEDRPSVLVRLGAGSQRTWVWGLHGVLAGACIANIHMLGWCERRAGSTGMPQQDTHSCSPHSGL
jgi:hypothetical protein